MREVAERARAAAGERESGAAMTTDPVTQAQRRWAEAIEQRLSKGEVQRRRDLWEMARRTQAAAQKRREAKRAALLR